MPDLGPRLIRCLATEPGSIPERKIGLPERTTMSMNLSKMAKKAKNAVLAPLTKTAREQAKTAREQAKQAREEANAAKAGARTELARARTLEAQLAEARQLSAQQDIHIKQMEWLSSQFNKVPPIPPRHLQVRVSGDYYWQFFMHGLHMLGDIDKALASQGLSLYGFQNVLDFGCGCGRFLIPLSLSMDPSRVHGSDIDGEAIDWFRSKYPHIGGISQNPHLPPTSFEDDSFDFVYSVSIFTHLPEEMQFAWLRELQRITKKGGWLVLTTHGRKFIGEMPPKYHQTFEQRGFFYLDEAGLTDGLPVFYKGAYHLHHYIEKEWSKYFRVVSMLEQGIGAHQDLILLQNAQ